MSLEKKHGIEILFEDNHLIILNKRISDIVQGDQTGDASLGQKLKDFLKEREKKPGNVFVGIPHRLDRPVSGVIVYTKTSKGLSRMTELFRTNEVEKIYHAITIKKPESLSGTLSHYLTRNTKQNKSYCHSSEVPGSKKAVLHYRYLTSSDRYYLLEIRLETGRHHQIRTQLAHLGWTIKGDIKYGAPRANRNGGISLHARRISFLHPIKKVPIEVLATYPEGDIFKIFMGD
ncbi:RluA family pseudouridine synthase [Bacteroidota bacterium]